MRIAIAWAIGLLPLIATASPATVVDHQLDVRIDRRGNGTAVQTWTVQVDEPDRLGAGLTAPPGLDGSVSNDARILGQLALFPLDIEPGDTFTFRSEQRIDRRGDGAVFQLAPDLLTESASFQVRSDRPQGVLAWADDAADFRARRSGSRRTITAEWHDVQAGAASWSTWADWNTLSAAVEQRVAAKLAGRSALGRDLSAGASTLGEPLVSLIDRVNQRVAVAPGQVGTLADAKDASDVLRSGSGTAVERALVLISVLRDLGHDARFAWVQPGPITLPVSAIPPTTDLFSLPAVAVVTPERTTWIDPGSAHATPPAIPAAFATGVAWATGQAPVALPSGAGAEGQARIQGSVAMGTAGDLAWDATLTATGPAEEHLRRLLSPLPPADREALLADHIVRERSPSARVDVSIRNLDRRTEPLRISLQVVEPGAFTPAGPGWQGVVKPLFAPALAAWLPPGVEVIEDVRLDLPSGMNGIGTPRPTSRNADAGLVSRTVQAEGARLLLHTEATQGRADVSREEIDRFFSLAARSAVELLLMPQLTRKDVKAVVRQPWAEDPLDRLALSVVLSARAGDARRAHKLIERREPDIAWDALAWRVSERSDSDQYGGLTAMWDVATDDSERATVASALATCCGDRVGWLRLAELVNTPDPAQRVEVLLAMLGTQPQDAPFVRDDPEGNQAWFEPDWLLERAEQAHREASGPDSADPRILRIRATQALAQGEAEAAETLLIDAMRLSRSPDLPILYAQAGLSLGVDVRETMLTVEEAVAAAPDDPDVLLAAADVLQGVGLVRRAVDRRRRAALLLYSRADLWDQVTTDALGVSDLATALDAARRASDLTPRSAERARTLEKLAWMAGDERLTGIAAQRLGQAPRAVLDLEETLDAVAIAERAAVLEYRDSQTRNDPTRLADRGLARLSRGSVYDASLDGLWLQTLGDARGDSIVAAASTGRMTPIVDTSSDSDVSAALTLTRGIVLGSPGAQASATLLEDNAVAAVMREWFRSRDTVIGDFQAVPIPGLRRPSGYVNHPILSGVQGVSAWTLRDGERSLLVCPDPELPPPLRDLVQRAQPAERRILGGVIERLVGLDLPVYAARVRVDGGWAWGIGFTQNDAEHAARDALEANPRQ